MLHIRCKCVALTAAETNGVHVPQQRGVESCRSGFISKEEKRLSDVEILHLCCSWFSLHSFPAHSPLQSLKPDEMLLHDVHVRFHVLGSD